MIKHDAQGRMVRQAFDFSYNGAIWHQMMFAMLFYQLGGNVLDSNGQAAFNGPEGVQALTLWRDIVFKYKLGDPNVSVDTGPNPNEDFTEGKMCMWMTGPWALPQIQVNADTYKHTIVVPVPQMNPDKPVTAMYGYMFALNAASSPEKLAVAQDFVRFAVRDPERWMRDAVFIQPKIGWSDTKTAASIPFLNVFMTDLSRGRYLVRSPYFNEITQDMSDAIDRVIFKGADPKASLDMAADQVNKLGK